MFSYLFTFRSQTAAQSGRRILYESGLRAQLRRAQRALAVALDERASRPEREASLVAARDLAQQIFEAVMPRHKKAIDESFQKQAKAIGLRRLPQLEA